MTDPVCRRVTGFLLSYSSWAVCASYLCCRTEHRSLVQEEMRVRPCSAKLWLLHKTVGTILICSSWLSDRTACLDSKDPEVVAEGKTSCKKVALK